MAQLLTLDIVANDQASDGLARVAGQAGHLSEEMQRLLTISRAFDRQAKQASAGTAMQVREQAKLINANALLETSTARQIRSSAALTNARAKEVRSIAVLTRAQGSLVRTQSQQGRDGRLEALGGSGSVAILDRLSGGAASSVVSFGALGPAVLGAGAALAAFDIAANVATRSISAQIDVLKGSVLAAAKFEQEIQRVAAITGSAAGSFDLLREAALKGGASTQFTAQQAGEALRFLAQSGLTAAESSQALPGALQLAAAGNLDLARAADIATNILQGYKLEVEDLGRVNDVLVKAANSSNTNVTELGVAFSYTAGVAAATNQEFESITAVLEVLANNGIKASKSGRAVANAISRIVKPTAAGRAVLDELGLSLTTADGKTKDLVTVLKDFERVNASAAQTLAFFGEVAGRSLITVLNSGTKEIDKFAAANRRAAGTAALFEKVVQDTAQGQLTILQSTLETLSITVGSRFLPALKEVSRVLIAQVAPLTTNTQFLRQFDTVAQGAVLALAELLDAAALLVPGFTRIGGVALDVVGVLTIFARAIVLNGKLIQAVTTRDIDAAGEWLSLLKQNYTQAADIALNFGQNLNAAGAIGDELSRSLSGAADGVRGINLAFGDERKIIDQVGASTKSALRIFGEFLGPASAPTSNVVEFNKLLKGLNVSLGQTATLVGTAFGITRTRLDPDADPGLEAKREEARLEAEIANATDARKRAELEFQKEILSLSQQELDDEVRGFKELEAFAKRTAALRAADEASRKRSRKEDISAKLAELRIAQELLGVDTDRERILLNFAAQSVRINATRDKQELKSAQIALARAETTIQLAKSALALDQQRGTALRAIGLQIAEEQAALGQVNQLSLVALQTRTALADLAAETDLDPAIRAERVRLILIQDQVKAAGALRTLRATEAKREASFEALALLDLEERGDIESQIAKLKIESAQRARDIAAEETDEITKQNLLLENRRKRDAAIAKLRAEAFKERTGAVRAGFAAGAATDTGAVSAQFAAEQERGLTLQVQSLEIAKQQAELRGQDTAFLERRIEQLRAEAEAERAVVEAQIARIEATAQLTAGVADLGTRLAEFNKLGFEGAGGYEAMGNAIASAAGLGSALAQGLGLSAKAAAKVQVAFNAAASIAAFAGFAASGFSQPNLLTASIQYGLAAAKFAAVAGAGGGGGAGGGRGGGGAGGGGLALPQFDAAAERDKTAQAFAKALRAQLEQPVQNVFNLDFRQATLLESTPAIGREVLNATDRARGSIHQSGRRTG